MFAFERGLFAAFLASDGVCHSIAPSSPSLEFSLCLGLPENAIHKERRA